MQLFTDEQIQQLLATGERSLNDPDFDPWPVAKLFTPDAGCTWLVTEMDPEEPDILWVRGPRHGYCEYGTVSLSELLTLRGRLGLPVEPDLYWKAQGPISAYIRASNGEGLVDCLPQTCDDDSG